MYKEILENGMDTLEKDIEEEGVVGGLKKYYKRLLVGGIDVGD